MKINVNCMPALIGGFGKRYNQFNIILVFIYFITIINYDTNFSLIVIIYNIYSYSLFFYNYYKINIK
jgi:hypothetical protein